MIPPMKQVHRLIRCLWQPQRAFNSPQHPASSNPRYARGRWKMTVTEVIFAIILLIPQIFQLALVLRDPENEEESCWMPPGCHWGLRVDLSGS